FFAWLKEADPDLLLGWNIAGFDLDFLQRKCTEFGLPYAVGRGSDRAAILQPETSRGLALARLPGRVALDGIELLRAGFWSFESFELDVVANELLGRGKAIKNPGQRLDEIRRMYRDDPVALAAYNLEDCRLVLDIFAKANLLAFARERAAATGLAMDRYGGSVAAVDHLYLPRLHRAGYVAPDVGDVDPGAGSPGGYVIDSQPGLYDNVLLLDFKSLYPSIIRTFRIDPLALVRPGDDPVPGFDGANFSRQQAILPELVADLWSVRDRAKADGHAALSQAVKILMNSLYGVLGATGCRFLDTRLTSSITRRGHQIIQQSQGVIEALGHKVIYGDTDSLFILPNERGGEADIKALGARLAQELNNWWHQHITEQFRLDSYLDIEFETHFLRFLMPTIRGAETGSKKRYAGLIRTADGGSDLVFKGLESVRTDWTPLARRFQRELYRLIFLNQPFEAYIHDTLSDLRAGRLDAELVYRKRLRHDLKDYTRNVPPMFKPHASSTSPAAGSAMSSPGTARNRSSTSSQRLTTGTTSSASLHLSPMAFWVSSIPASTCSPAPNSNCSQIENENLAAHCLAKVNGVAFHPKDRPNTRSCMMSLQGEVALVTGASRGVGRAIARRLAREGVKVGLCSRTVSDLEALAAEIASEGGAALPCCADIREAAQVDSCVAQIRKMFGDPGILVNNAGIGWHKGFLKHSRDEIDAVLDVNLKGTISMSYAALPAMLERGDGHIINIASDVGRRAIPDMVPYVTAKHAVVGFSHALRREVRTHGVRVSVLTPGRIDSYFHGGAEGDLDETQALQPQALASAVCAILMQPDYMVIDELSLHALGQDA
ncbi:MAG: DNA polymerase II, partial [Geminicoccaceae bacterium]